VQEVVLSLDERGRHGARTTIVKVHGHTGEPLHAVADAMATEGAERKTEVDERPLYEIPEPTKRGCHHCCSVGSKVDPGNRPSV
jgi:hypothetical protein